MLKKLLTPSFLIAVATTFASSPIGTWNGKLKITPPPGAAPGSKADTDKAIKSSHFKLVFNADHSYTADVQTPMDKFVFKGTWTQKGDIVTTHPKTRNGKPDKKVKGEPPVTYKIATDGKTMDRVINPYIAIIFTKKG